MNKAIDLIDFDEYLQVPAVLAKAVMDNGFYRTEDKLLVISK